jgi:TonB family protein
MAPSSKDVETLTATSTPAVAANSASKNPQDAVGRAQPVPLEVPVSVNGARTVEGTDKREPFSESTKTVLVFANGAVIRLASSVAPGQLLFVTNEKSKKEVVCQVVKSKNYRTVTGYVELEFTEPAAGFWGVRIPEQAAATPKPPATPRPLAPSAVPAAGVPKAPTAAPIAPALVTTKPSLPSAAPVTPAMVPPLATIPATPEAVKVQASQLEVKLPTVAEFLASSIAPSPIPPPKAEALPAQLADKLSALVHSNVVAPPAAKLEHPTTPAAPTVPATPSNDATTDDLRQQAARLQEQLSSLLFRAESAEKKSAAPAVTIPVEPAKIPDTPKPNAATEIPPSNPSPAIAKAEVAVPPAIVEEKSNPVPVYPAETKPLPRGEKSTQFNLKVEEVKIPSWLAPLARDGESQSSSIQDKSTSSGVDSDTHTLVDSSAFAEDRSASQSVVFGGQLLGGAAETQETSLPSGSRTGLTLGLAAAIVLVVGGGIWYGLQPGNFLAKKSPAAQSTPSTIATVQPSDAVRSPSATATNSAPINSAPPVAINTRPVTAPPANVPPVEAANAANLTAHAVSAVEQPKRPVLGDVHLATPNVNRTGTTASSEAAPTIDAQNAEAAGDPLAGIATNDGHQPAVPAPVGGDVQAAQLRQSVPPVYPATARTQRVAGDVKLDALIDAEGNVTATKILSGPVLLHQAATVAVKQWKYQPATLDGKPTAMHLTVTVQFRLQ